MDSIENPKFSGSILTSLVDQNLISISFVLDYLQVGFESSSLTFLEWPQIELDGVSYYHEDRDYRMILCSLLGKSVTTIQEVADTYIKIDFQGGAALNASLINSPFPDAVIFNNRDGAWNTWP